MIKDLTAGGTSVLTASIAIAVLASLGFPFPSNPVIGNLFIYVLAPVAALGGYVVGRLMMSAKLPRRHFGYIVLGTVVLTAAMALFYLSNVLRPLSPGPIFFFIYEVIPFMLCISALYFLISVAGLKLASSSTGDEAENNGHGTQEQKEQKDVASGRRVEPNVNRSKAMAGKRIFLAHAREDKAEVRQLYTDLKARGLDPWLDEIDIGPGQNWKVEIPKAIRQAGVFLACLSSRSVGKVGYVQSEFRLALSAYGEWPPGSVFLIPVRLDDCEVPDLQIPELGLNLRDIQWVDLWQTGGFDRLVNAIQNAR